MKTHYLYAFVCVLAVPALALGWVLGGANTEDELVDLEVSRYEGDDAFLEQENRRLTNESKALRYKLNAVEQKLEERGPSPDAGPSHGNQKPVEGTYQEEPVNAEWATPRESAIRNAFAIDGTLQGAVLNSVDCRSASCRIQLYYRDNQEVEQLANSLYSHLLNNQYELSDEFRTTSVRYLDDELAEIYLSRNVEVFFLQ